MSVMAKGGPRFPIAHALRSFSAHSKNLTSQNRRVAVDLQAHMPAVNLEMTI